MQNIDPAHANTKQKEKSKKITGVEQGMQQRTTKAECTKGTTSHKEKKENNIQIKMEPKITIAHNHKTDNTQNKIKIKMKIMQ